MLAGETPAHERPPPPPPQPVADESRIHLYEAVSTQRDKVLDSFDTQRAAVLKAVADQRAAALAPITAVNEKRAMQLRAGAATSLPLLPSHIAATGNGMIGAAGRRQLVAESRRVVAAQIVASLKALVAAEVRAQLAPLQAPTPSAPEHADPAAGPPDQKDQA